MNEQRRLRTILVVLALMSALILPAACGNSKKKSTSPAKATPLSSATVVGLNTCTRCHTTTASEWLLSKHANLDANNSLDSTGNPASAEVTAGACAGCHDPNGDSARLVANYTGNVVRPVIGCEACHGGGSLHAGGGGTGPISIASIAAGQIGTTAVSAQYNTCTSCHQLLDPATGVSTTFAVHDATTTSPTPTGRQYVITDTHFASSGTWTASNNTNSLTISGYAMDYSSETVCSNCHNPHGTADINRDWAVSLHADTNRGHAWALYNFTCDGTDPTTCGTSTLLSTNAVDNNNRWLCQPCHTTTGYAAMAEALESGDTVLAGQFWAGTASVLPFNQAWKPERLGCNGCHSDNRGTVRQPGAFKAVYSYWPAVSTSSGPAFDPVGNPPKLDVYARATVQFPDLSTSNECVICHSGRNSGKAVHNLNTDGTLPTVDFTNLRFGDPHRFTSAATMFKTVGYEFDGRDYADAPTFMHDKIGSSEAPNTGTNGPCVGCHMYQPGRSASHLMAAVAKTGSVITNISSEVCFGCHANSSAGLAKIADDGRIAYLNGKNVLTFFLGPQSANGLATAFTLTTTNPHTTTVNWLTPGDADSSGNTTGKNNLGAMFNSRYLSMERGAYIHNSTYVKRLIYDSVDWLDDNQMNYSVGSLLTSATLSTNATVTLAQPYLLPNGNRWSTITNSGAPSERP